MVNSEKNVALILGGGVGLRMHNPLPKQFHIVRGKPVIVHTIEAFQNSAAIDDIVVVVKDEWKAIVQKYIQEFSLDKVTGIVSGGETGFQSIRNGVNYLNRTYSDQDIVLIHDAVRPLLGEETINSNIVGAKEHGNAITVVPATEALLYSVDGETSNKVVNRNYILRTQTPQSIRLKDLVQLHEEAAAHGITDTVATCTLLIELGHTVHTVMGDNTNFKLTRAEDISLFEAFLDARRIQQEKEV